MDKHRISKETLKNTLHNINVMLYALEEVLNSNGTELPAMKEVKVALVALRDELDEADLPVEIAYTAPTPAQSLLAGDPTQRLRKNVCNP